MTTLALVCVVVTYAVGWLAFAVWCRRYRGMDGFNALMCGMSWPLLPVVLLVWGIGVLFEMLVKVKE